MLPLLLKSDYWERVDWPLAGPRVQNGHFPQGKAAAINSHPAPPLFGGCSAWDSEKIDWAPLTETFEFKIHLEKIKSRNLDSGWAS